MAKLPIFTRRALGIASVPLLLAALGACATPFKADVSRFQQLPAPQGQSFVVTASDPELQGGLEFAQYATLVEAQMERLGYVPTNNPANANLVVSFDYEVDNGRDRVRSTGFGGYDPFSPFGGRGYYGRRWRGSYGFGFYDPWIYGRGYNDIDSYTVYTSELDLKIDRVADNERLFEGKAEAMSRSKQLPYLVPNLVEAMFTGFPGNSGETVRISIAPEEKTVRTVNR